MSSFPEASWALHEVEQRTSERGCDPFACAGEMAALMRSFAWDGTPLGPASSWSPALRIAVGIVLRSPCPMLLCWGPRFAQLYNDACRPVLGAKHPASLGQPAGECWPEMWGMLGPMLETPFAGRPGGSIRDLCLLVDRAGILEEAHFDVACGSVPDDAAPSGIGGVLATFLETTPSARERQAERRRADRLAEIDRAQGELRRLEEEHRVTEAARERLAETLRLNELFVAVLGHDLRTPLSAISLGAAILLKRSALRPDDARAVARIASSADRIARMIGQVLDLTRSRLGGGIPVQPVRIDLHEVARKVVDELKLAHPDATFQLRLLGDALGEWDPDRLAQMISNLGGNAVQHGAQAPVTVAVAGTPDSVSISVHNDGPSIPAEAMASIFDAFRTGTRSPGGSGGLGLGLYITREIVRAHCGSILVRSSEGKGTTFTAVLPRRAGDRVPASDTAAAMADDEPAPRPHG